MLLSFSSTYLSVLTLLLLPILYVDFNGQSSSFWSQQSACPVCPCVLTYVSASNFLGRLFPLLSLLSSIYIPVYNSCIVLSEPLLLLDLRLLERAPWCYI